MTSAILGGAVPETLGTICSLMKPRVSGMVVFSTGAGYLLAGRGVIEPLTLTVLILGTLATCAGSLALNQYLERDTDKLMKRTSHRPLVTGRIAAADVLGLGILLVVVGVTVLALFTNMITAFLALLTAFVYVLIYTPLKRVTWLNTLVGAIPGALPIAGGWVAVTGVFDLGASLLFLLLFIWQLPHFYSIAWLYREDYGRAGLRMIPSVDTPDGRKTFLHIFWSTVLLVPLTLVPYFTNFVGLGYLFVASLSGLLLLRLAWQVSKQRSELNARRMMRATVLYLPLLLSVAVCSVMI